MVLVCDVSEAKASRLRIWESYWQGGLLPCQVLLNERFVSLQGPSQGLYQELYSHLGWVSSFKLAQFGPHELHDFVYGIGHGYAGIGKSC